MHILVTGGAGFIGSNFVHLLRRERPDWLITVLDKLTYAGNPRNLEQLKDDITFIKGDVAEVDDVRQAMEGCDAVINFAAETHVDRSIVDADAFIRTDVYGAYVLLEAAKALKIERFVQVSTDEVYGEVPEGFSVETDPLMPRNPYAASKAGADRLAYSYWATHDVPVIISRASNNYGPRQYPEKLLPLFVTNAIDGLECPIYGEGKAVRDWIHVDDHCRGLLAMLERGAPGEVYNCGGGNLRDTNEMGAAILEAAGKPLDLLKHVPDRPGHDMRYALDSTKLKGLDWKPRVDFRVGLEATVDWYRDNEDWWRPIKSGEFKQWWKQYYLDEGRA
ncbi:MAG: dTDP-glucose 4,6-dehydratase [Candidatus Coatesbacteria bacterium]|nr:dTDP-glucose 4,6-dehydratase [Candidatus Coatesbacteria bacterium]